MNEPLQKFEESWAGGELDLNTVNWLADQIRVAQAEVRSLKGELGMEEAVE